LAIVNHRSFKKDLLSLYLTCYEMKNLLLITVLFTTILFRVQAQNTLPNTHVNIGVGLGAPYGVVGTKTILGYRNSGLMVGLGVVPGGLFGYEIGAQLSSQSFYVNLGYGVTGVYQVNNEPAHTIQCGNLMVGCMLNLNKSKNVFLDIAGGHTLGAPTVQIGPFEENQGGFTASLGVGVRLVKKK
jgi:hypothetical protein